MTSFSSNFFLLVLCTSILMTTKVESASCNLNKEVHKELVLELHNVARERWGGVANGVLPLTWDDDIACNAQKWADKCIFEHSHTSPGENLGGGHAEDAVMQWYGEIDQYKDGMGFTMETGHVTQMVWKESTKIGCAVSACTSAQLGFGDPAVEGEIVVCQYNPGGNAGDFSKNVFFPKDKSPLTLSSIGGKKGPVVPVVPAFNPDMPQPIVKEDPIKKEPVTKEPVTKEPVVKAPLLQGGPVKQEPVKKERETPEKKEEEEPKQIGGEGAPKPKETENDECQAGPPKVHIHKRAAIHAQKGTPLSLKLHRKRQETI